MRPVERPDNAWLVGLLVVVVAALAVGWAWWQSKRESSEMRQMDEEFARQAAEAARVDHAAPVGTH
jgi:hypothetical protein